MAPRHHGIKFVTPQIKFDVAQSIVKGEENSPFLERKIALFVSMLHRENMK